IAAGFPAGLGSIWQTQGWRTFVVVMIIGIAVMMLIVFVEDSQRRIPVQYARRQIGRRTVGSTTTYIPIKVNMAGFIPVLCASSYTGTISSAPDWSAHSRLNYHLHPNQSQYGRGYTRHICIVYSDAAPDPYPVQHAK